MLYSMAMKALVKTIAGVGLELKDIPEPEVGYNDVLIRIKKTSICGTDVHIWKWDEWASKTIPVGMNVGHEYCGIVEQIGPGVTKFKVGDYVTGEGHLVCNTCRNCKRGLYHLCPNTQGVGVNRPGCFAELLSIPESNVISLHPSIPESVAAIMDACGNATYTALTWNLVGEDVLITGAGPIGVMAVAICKKAGARSVTITDVLDSKLEYARLMGADEAINVTKESIDDARRRLDLKEGFDVCLEMSGAPSCLQDIIKHSINGAKISLLGIQPSSSPIDWNEFIWKGLQMKGIYGREMFDTWYIMQSMIRSGLDLTPIITHEFDYTDFEKGFEAMMSGQSCKVVLKWSD